MWITLARQLPRPVLFALLYLRNTLEFDCIHVRTVAATRMDVALIQRRGRP